MKKWLTTSVVGIIILSIIANNISDEIRHIPIITPAVNLFVWIYKSGLRLLNYKIAIWVLLVLLGSYYIIKFVYRDFIKKEPDKPDYYNWNHEIFDKWIWKWSYQFDETRNDWAIVNPQPYCPIDDVLLLEDEGFLNQDVYCPKCKTVYHFRRGEVELQQDIYILIRDKINKKHYRI